MEKLSSSLLSSSTKGRESFWESISPKVVFPLPIKPIRAMFFLPSIFRQSFMYSSIPNWPGAEAEKACTKLCLEPERLPSTRELFPISPIDILIRFLSGCLSFHSREASIRFKTSASCLGIQASFTVSVP